ncbi:MAG TPA: ABC transporter substrate-binding protein [Candidatus Binatia bacterium]|nr:ABC transporter substrate-binding protein [Candidatus Binatia bacterium]
MKKSVACSRWSVVSFLALSVVLFALCVPLHAQQPAKVARIGFLYTVSPSSVAARAEAFRQGLRELGYVEGKNIVIESRFADGKLDRVPSLAAELVRLKVDIIVTSGPSPTRAAKEATVTIPIVMARDIDPVGNGFVASLARPGGNITGLSMLAPEISGKQLELLKETVPKLSRVAVLGTSTTQGNEQTIREIELAAGAFGVKLQYLDVADLKDIETAFRAAVKGRADAVLVLGSAIYASHRKQVAEMAVRNRLSTIYRNSEYVDDGGLMAYGVNLVDLDRRAATYVHKILKGAKPADIPVEQPTKFELVINLRTAKQIGLTIPPNVLARADRIIK